MAKMENKKPCWRNKRPTSSITIGPNHSRQLKKKNERNKIKQHKTSLTRPNHSRQLNKKNESNRSLKVKVLLSPNTKQHALLTRPKHLRVLNNNVIRNESPKVKDALTPINQQHKTSLTRPNHSRQLNKKNESNRSLKVKVLLSPNTKEESPIRIQHKNRDESARNQVKKKSITTYFRSMMPRKVNKSRGSNVNATGLSPKENSFIINTLQRDVKRYAELKQLAESAKQHGKIFSIHGYCYPLKKALLERGWVEKIPVHKMNLGNIQTGNIHSETIIHRELETLFLSKLVEKYNANLIWHTQTKKKELWTDIISKDGNPIINKLQTEPEWTTKQGLCCSIKRNCWFHIDDVAELNAPRSYYTYDVGEIEEFSNDYKLTACTSLLKWTLSMIHHGRPVFQDTGKISFKTIVFAVNRCKDYLYKQQNRDIDQSLRHISNGQWKSFFNKYYRIISKRDVFGFDKKKNMPLYLTYAKFLLNEIHRYRPQLSCEGCHNIWIIKPAHCSRGRGIRLASKIGEIANLISKSNIKHVVQKYIEEPLLIHDTKFDIRQYYLVTSIYPLEIWMYKDCYLKFSSQKYSLKNYHESIHLTNYAVQKNYKNCLGRHVDLPRNNMWDAEKCRSYLDDNGYDKVWDKIIYPGMKKAIIGVMLSCQDSLHHSNNRFELFGCDFILDTEFKPWLIEINSCPDLNATTQVTANICAEVIADIVKVIVDRAANPKASTGKFECIYRQPITKPNYGATADLFVKGNSLPQEYFYTGSVEIQETLQEPITGTVFDINAILDKLRFQNNKKITEPESSFENIDGKKRDAADDEINKFALLLDEFFNKYDDEASESSTDLNKGILSFEQDYANEQESSIKYINREQSRCAGNKTNNGTESFNISQLAHSNSEVNTQDDFLSDVNSFAPENNLSINEIIKVMNFMNNIEKECIIK